MSNDRLARPATGRWFPWLAGFLLATVVLWAWWPTLLGLAERWASDAQYSHGFLVPAFALGLLWLRRACLRGKLLRPSFLGVALVLLGCGLRLLGAFYHYEWVDAISLLPTIAGGFWLLGGWACFTWSLPAVAFLFFMVPLPHSISIALAAPLQEIATHASTFLLQVLGQPAIAEGNVILLNEVELGVVEACSGLRMLMIFFALSTAVALLMQRPMWERATVLASAVPIALLTNILRITVTGVLYETAGSEVAHLVFHDLAGWLMMPVALALLGLEMAILQRLFLSAAEEGWTGVQTTRVAVPVVAAPPGEPAPRRGSRKATAVERQARVGDVRGV